MTLTVVFTGATPHERRTVQIEFTEEQAKDLIPRDLKNLTGRTETVTGVWLEACDD